MLFGLAAVALLSATGAGPVVREIGPPTFPMSKPRYTATVAVGSDVASSRAQVYLDGKHLLIASEGLPNVVTTLSGMIGKPDYATCPGGFMVAERHDNVSMQLTLHPRGDAMTDVEVVGDFTSWRRGWFAGMMSRHSGSGRWFGKSQDCVTTGRLEKRVLDAIANGVPPDEVQQRDGVFGAAPPSN